eukprot:Protomagalhaensia_sp_Gyna_25__2767@NODE_2598_length_988_cov_149_257113_g2159_i0_p1_GENE_NODE_2598_length_988_cov_149_257113_g2159_i0NODE_2598_length_988_cov_149_257113_g2159_i0_p1_ORF_typecomplete_len219_score26_14I_LWEQ/PF01608_17/0_054DUF4141/PF13605_6/1_7DUF948/PF06103_11/2DUF948/PF06103_11/3_9e02_NODE_2598_length_988_cov_149_257113_g2159_i0231887
MRRRREDVSRCRTKVITDFTQGTLQSAKEILETAERILENTTMTPGVLESTREIVASTQNILESTRGVLNIAETESGRTHKTLSALGRHAKELERKVSDLELTRSTGFSPSSGNWSRSSFSPCSQCEPIEMGSGDYFTDFQQNQASELKGKTAFPDDPLPFLVEMAKRAGALSTDHRLVQPVDLFCPHGLAPRVGIVPLAQDLFVNAQDFEAWFLANG